MQDVQSREPSTEEDVDLCAHEQVEEGELGEGDNQFLRNDSSNTVRNGKVEQKKTIHTTTISTARSTTTTTSTSAMIPDFLPLRDLVESVKAEVS